MVIKMITKQVDMNNIHLLPEKKTKSMETAMDGCLESISPENRVIFMRRYWFCDTYAEIAAHYGISERKVKRLLQDTRKMMCIYLNRPWGSFGINEVDIKFIREAESTTFRVLDGNQHHFLLFALDFARFIISSIRSPEYV